MSTKSKGDILETITEILEKSISDKSTIISKKKKIKDLDGIVREIDIYIETITNKRKFSIAIECKNYKEKSKIDMDKIGAFYEKCSRLPFISKMIFLTTSDYQKGAIDKAKARNVELYRISTEPLTKENKLAIEKISIVEKKCKILGIRFNSKKLFKNGILTDEKLNLYSENNTLLKNEDIIEKLIELPDIWKFLFTKSGLLFNHKKIIYPNLKTKNIYTNFKGEYYAVDTMQLTLEIEYALNPLELNKVKKYQSITEETTLAIFSDLEFVLGGMKHQLCYVQPTDDNEGKFFISSENETPIELKTLGTLSEVPKSLSGNNSKVQNIKVLPYEFKMTKEAFENSVSKNKTAPEDANSKFLKNLKTKKSSILVGLQEQKLFFMIPFSHNHKLITAKFPEPISLYFNHSIDLYQKSIIYRDTMVANSPSDETILMQDDSYHKFLQYSISCIFMLHSSIELFINSCLKDNLEIEIEGKLFKKGDLEEELTLPQKIENIIPLISKYSLKTNKRFITRMNELNELNEALLNLKVSDSIINQPFLETFERLLKLDMGECFELVKDFFRKVNKDFKLNEI